jgi:predicted ribosomally synthesized peptide with SipW-like signal peptide
LAVGATGAYFSDSEVVAGNTFAAGSVDLDLTGSNPIPFNIK